MSDYEKWINHGPLTIVDSGPLHFCLEYRLVEIHGQTVQLTNKEFVFFALLVLNPRRVFTYNHLAGKAHHFSRGMKGEPA